MPDAIISEILRSSVSGAVFLALGFLYWRKEQELSKLNKARIDDAQAVQAQLLKNNTDCVTALRDVANAMVTQREMLGELRDTFKEFGEELRRINKR